MLFRSIKPGLEGSQTVVPIAIAVAEGDRHEVRVGGGIGLDPLTWELRARAGYSITGPRLWGAEFPLTTMAFDIRPAEAFVRENQGWTPDLEQRDTPMLFKGAPEFTKQLVMQARVGAMPFMGADHPMEVGGWTALPEPRPLDALSLALFADAWFPPSFIGLSEPAISPTVDLTIHFRQPPPPQEGALDGVCLGIFTTKLLREGFFEEDGVIWAPDGTVLVNSRQLGLILPTDNPVLEPEKLEASQAASSQAASS